MTLIDYEDELSKSDDSEGEQEPIARVRRKLKHHGDQVKAANRLLKTEIGKSTKTYTWIPAGGSTWTEWEDVYEKRSLRYFRNHPGLYEIEGVNDGE